MHDKVAIVSLNCTYPFKDHIELSLRVYSMCSSIILSTYYQVRGFLFINYNTTHAKQSKTFKMHLPKLGHSKTPKIYGINSPN